MATAFPLKVGDLLPLYRARLKDAAGAPLDLTSAVSVTFRMRAVGASTVKVNAAGAIVDAANGIVEYAWTGTDTDTAGHFDTLFLITWPGTKPQTVPPSGFGLVKIEASF
jgi:hypothetical protein